MATFWARFGGNFGYFLFDHIVTLAEMAFNAAL